MSYAPPDDECMNKAYEKFLEQLGAVTMPIVSRTDLAPWEANIALVALTDLLAQYVGASIALGVMQPVELPRMLERLHSETHDAIERTKGLPPRQTH